MSDMRVWLTIEAGGFVSRVALDVGPPSQTSVDEGDMLAEASTRDGFRAMALEVEYAAALAAGSALAHAVRRRQEAKR